MENVLEFLRSVSYLEIVLIIIVLLQFILLKVLGLFVFRIIFAFAIKDYDMVLNMVGNFSLDHHDNFIVKFITTRIRIIKIDKDGDSCNCSDCVKLREERKEQNG